MKSTHPTGISVGLAVLIAVCCNSLIMAGATASPLATDVREVAVTVEQSTRVVTASSKQSWKLGLPEHVTIGKRQDHLGSWEVIRGGKAVGLVLGPLALDEAGKQVPLAGKITEDNVVEAMVPVNSGAVTVGVVFEPYRENSLAETTAGSRVNIQGATPVTVPRNYVYDPNRKWPSLEIRWQHDYCSWSPDSLGKADFRGPCAVHDMCYEQYNGKPKNEKKDLRGRSCQEPFRNNLRVNCEAYLAGIINTPARAACLAAKEVYYEAVVNQNRFS